MTENQENRTPIECLNCYQQLPDQAAFCPNCGQKSTDGLVSLKEFLTNFLDNVFNLDSRIVQTLKWLCVPAKLTKEYFKGKHRTYYHPIRLYLVMSIIFFAVLNFSGGILEDNNLVTIDSDEEEFSLEEMIAEERYKIVFLEEIDTLSKQISLFQDTTAKAAFDSLKEEIEKGMKINQNSFNITIDGEQKVFDYKDIVTLSGKELVKKYEIKGFWNQVKTKQILHFVHDQSGFQRHLVNNFPLMLLAMLPFLALFMKLLYIRNNRFYIEHLVLNFHHHAFAFFILSLFFILPDTIKEILIVPILIVIFAFLFFTMKKYYEQGYRKTFLKFVAFNIFYLFSFLVVLCITFIISFLLF